MTQEEVFEFSKILSEFRKDPKLWAEFVNIANGILQDEINKEVVKSIYEVAMKEE